MGFWDRIRSLWPWRKRPAPDWAKVWDDLDFESGVKLYLYPPDLEQRVHEQADEASAESSRRLAEILNEKEASQ